MKITVVSMSNPCNAKTWSGTTKNIVNVLNKKANVETITLENRNTLMLKKWTLRFFKYIKRQQVANFETTKFGAKYWGYRLDKMISKQKHKSDFYIIPGGAAIIAYSKTNQKLVDVADATYSLMDEYYYSNVNSFSKKEGNEIDKLALNRANKIVVSSKWAEKSVIKDYDQPKCKVKNILFGANLPDVNIKPKNIKNKTKINLLLVGIDRKRKGIDEAIKIIKYLNNKDIQHKYKLTIIGVDSKEKIESVNFLGKLDKSNPLELKKIQKNYLNADIFILPTQAEAAGIANAEAEMYGLPVFTTNTGGVPDYVLNNKTGYTFPLPTNIEEYGNKIIELVNNPKKYEELSQNSINLYRKKLNWNTWADEVIKFLKLEN